METVTKEFITTGEAMAVLGISKTLFFRLKKRHNLKTFGIGDRKNLYRMEDVLSLVQERNPKS